MEIERARYKYDRRQPKRRLKRALIIAAAVLLAGAAGSYTTLAISQPVPALAAEPTLNQTIEPQEISDIAWPAKGQAAFGTLRDGVLASKDNEIQMPMASITKVVTALAVLENQPLEEGESGPEFIISQPDIDSYRRYVGMFGAVMPVNLGQTISQLDALKGMMLPSANNMADSLAIWIFGSMDQYLTYANNMLDRYGLANTEVADASGFNPGSRSTPSDLIELGRRALSHPVLGGIVGQSAAVLPVTGEIKNTNALLSDDDAIGIKTGNTDEAGSCLLYAYRFGPDKSQVFIGVVMGQPNYYGMFYTARALKDSVLPHFKIIEVIPAGTVVGRINSSWGGSVDVVTVEPLKTFGWPGETYQADVRFDNSEPPLLKNQVIGSLSAGDASVNVVARENLNPPSLFWRLANYW